EGRLRGRIVNAQSARTPAAAAMTSEPMPTSMRRKRSQRRRPGANRRPPTGLLSEAMRRHYTGAIISPAMRSELLRDFQRRDLIADLPPPGELDAHGGGGRRPAYVGF